MNYGLMHTDKGEWWVVTTQYPLHYPDLLIQRLKAASHLLAKKEARKLGFKIN